MWNEKNYFNWYTFRVYLYVLFDLNLLFRSSNIHCDILYDLNSWDKRRLDQPDFDCRMNALKKINILLDNNNVSVEFGAFVIYNCFYIFNYVSNNIRTMHIIQDLSISFFYFNIFR